MLKTLCVFGTRPEAIKMAPVITALKANKAITNQVCVTGQHQEMLSPVLNLFNITPDYNLNVMKANQDLSDLTATILVKLTLVIKQASPNLILVHGDTTTTLAASLAAYYHHIPVAHIEAGLRTGNIYAPWPEEINRKLTASLAMLHFAPTHIARQNLIKEGIAESTIYITGNTVIDALYEACNLLETNPSLQEHVKQSTHYINPGKTLILVTGHRRENFGEGFKQICEALIEIASQFPNTQIIYPVHLNPRVQIPVKEALKNMENIKLVEPLDYLSFVYLMKQAYIILTDSGGIQEEAPSMGKPVLVLRDISERPEAVHEGTVKLVGTKKETIVNETKKLLIDAEHYQRMSRVPNPYGDGQAANRIVEIIAKNMTVCHMTERQRGSQC